MILLEQSLPSPGLLFYSGAIGPQQPLHLIGYNANLDAIQIADQCSPYQSRRFHSELLLLHDCDSEGGSSGGAILATENGMLKIVAIHGGTLVARESTETTSATTQSTADPERVINQARKIDDQIRRALQQLTAIQQL